MSVETSLEKYTSEELLNEILRRRKVAIAQIAVGDEVLRMAAVSLITPGVMDKLTEIASILLSLTVNEIKSRSRLSALVTARQIIMYAAVAKMGVQLHIVRKFFNVNHASVLHLVNKAKQQMVSDAKFSKSMDAYLKMCDAEINK